MDNGDAEATNISIYWNTSTYSIHTSWYFNIILHVYFKRYIYFTNRLRLQRTASDSATAGTKASVGVALPGHGPLHAQQQQQPPPLVPPTALLSSTAAAAAAPSSSSTLSRSHSIAASGDKSLQLLSVARGTVVRDLLKYVIFTITYWKEERAFILNFLKWLPYKRISRFALLKNRKI